MSEKEPKEDYSIRDFDPREVGQAIILLFFEYKDNLENLPEAEGFLWLDKAKLLGEEVRRGEEGDVDMIRGLTSELKGLLLKIGCPSERMEKENLIKFMEARLKVARQEYGIGGVEEQDPFAPPKKKEYKN